MFKKNRTNLEECQEIIEFLLLTAFIEAHPTSVKKHTDKSDAEEVIRHINSAELSRKRPSFR